MDATLFRDLIDPLYGHIAIDPFLAALATQPEMQRLRDVRLSNINSQLLPGSANISRFEHSLGVAHLAGLCADKISLDDVDRRILIAAGALHDVGITPFGHLMEEAIVLSGGQFAHETRLAQVFAGESGIGNIHFQVFRGCDVGLRGVLARREFRDERLTTDAVFALIRGEGSLGPLISADVDLDNIDNVCRMAYHIGLTYRKSLPTELACAFRRVGNALCLVADGCQLIEEWLSLRSRLYSVLMTNPLDFSAKAMMIEAIRRALEADCGVAEPALTPEDWTMTDSELVARLRSYHNSDGIIRRLDLGDYYDLLTLSWILPDDKRSVSVTGSLLELIRSKVAATLHIDQTDVLVHAIRDKRVRKVSLPVVKHGSTDVERVSFGAPSRAWLIGVVTAKRGLANRATQLACDEVLGGYFDGCHLTACDSRATAQQATRDVGAANERRLF
jgi:uncharacterized protein